MDKCINCGKELKGRAGKKFCDDQCRSTYHNNLYKENDIALRTINKILKKNYYILRKVIEEAPNEKFSLESLSLLGFNPNHYTSINLKTTTKHIIEYSCYDINYFIYRNVTLFCKSN